MTKFWVEEGVGWCTGTVKKMNVDVKDDPWWDVEYDDGDVETYNWNEISLHLTNFQLGRHCIDDDDE